MKYKKKAALLALTGIMLIPNKVDLNMHSDTGTKLPDVQVQASKLGSEQSQEQARMERIIHLVKEAGKKYGVSPNLILAVIKSESDFVPDRVSDKGAVGLMQVIPRYTDYTAEQLKNPKTNIFTGTKILSDNISEFKSVRRALEAYNAGGSRVFDDSVPESAHAYVRRTMQNYITFSVKAQRSEEYGAAYMKALRNGSFIIVGFVNMPRLFWNSSPAVFGTAAPFNFRDMLSRQFASNVAVINSLPSQDLAFAMGVGLCVYIYIRRKRLVTSQLIKPLMKLRQQLN